MGTKEISIEDILKKVDAQIAGTTPQYELWQEELIAQLDVLRQDVALTYLCAPDTVTISPFSEVGRTMIYDVTYQDVVFRVEIVKYSGELKLQLKVIKPGDTDTWVAYRIFGKPAEIQKNIKNLYANWLNDNMSYLRQIRSKKV